MKNIKKGFIIFLVILTVFSFFNCDDNPGSISSSDSGNNNGNDNNNGNNSGNNNGNGNNNVESTLVEFLTSLQTTAENGGSYIYEIKADEIIPPQDLSYKGKENITITLKSDNINRIISLSTTGAMFIVRSGVTLVLENNLTLQGHVLNTQALILVAADAMLIMNDGVKITGNNNTNSSGGGGVVLSSAISAVGQKEGGKFLMNGGEISNNIALGLGGGVAISSNALFTMKSGKIYNNSVPVSMTVTTSNGGGVLAYGNFIMEGGEIFGNSVSCSSANGAHGGGVYALQADFTMKGGKIYGNTATSTTMATGGGVYIAGTTGYPATFIMEDGEISSNTVTAATISRGGGVQVGSGSVQSSNNSFIIKTGGIITGFADDAVNGNTVKSNATTIRDNYGHAVYSSSSIRRESTAGTTVNLDSSITGISGGWGN